MTALDQLWRDAESIAEDVLFEQRDSRRGARLQNATERIAEVLLEYKRRGGTETWYARWLECLRSAAIQRARLGQPLGGPGLSMLAERLFIG